jgi:hypothetical protein
MWRVTFTDAHGDRQVKLFDHDPADSELDSLMEAEGADSVRIVRLVGFIGRMPVPSVEQVQLQQLREQFGGAL